MPEKRAYPRFDKCGSLRFSVGSWVGGGLTANSDSHYFGCDRARNLLPLGRGFTEGGRIVFGRETARPRIPAEPGNSTMDFWADRRILMDSPAPPLDGTVAQKRPESDER